MSGILLLAWLIAAVPAAKSDLEAAIDNYYSSILTGKVIGWEIEFRRYPELDERDYQITCVRGEDEMSIPRGMRLCWVDMIVDGRSKSLPVTLRIDTVEEVPLAREDIPPRTALDDSLVVWKVMKSNELGSTIFPSRNDICSQWSKVRIAKGNVISAPRIESIPQVAIGDDVVLISRCGTVEVKTKGKALGDGYIGEKIRVENGFNGKRLRGIVEDKGVILVK